MTSAQRPEHPLDRVVWLSLTTRHSKWAQGDQLVKRYPTDMAPFHALRDDSSASFAAMARISSPDHLIALVTTKPLSIPDEFEVVERKILDQMLGPTTTKPVDTSRIELLGPSDQAAMLELVMLARPGPFLARTNQTGSYFGIRDGERLVAMTGERMQPLGFSELSAVCVHPDARGRGYAGQLLQHVANIAIERGDRPFLHVFDENRSAIALYHKFGFTLRHPMCLAVVRKRA
jgi:ribosomal protein S18 acetylase RimI-like enzyme